MSPQQFSLRWNNHTKNLVQVFAEQFEHQQHVDVTISCQGRFLKAHKIVLGACSPYFQDLFDSHESTLHPIIIMNGYNFEDIRSIVEFMYRGEVMVAETAMQRLLAAAEELQIKGLSNVRSKRDSNNHHHNNINGSSSSSNSQFEDEHEEEQQRGGCGEMMQEGEEQEQHDEDENHGGDRNDSLNQLHSHHHHKQQQQQVVEAQPKSFIKKRKRARTQSYDNNDMKRKLRVAQNKLSPPQDHPLDASTTTTSSQSLDEAQSSSDHATMTINIEPTTQLDDEDESKEQSTDETLQQHHQKQQQPPPLVVVKDTEQKEKIPRPPNSFMIFANEWRRQLAGQFPNESNKEISVRLGVMWKNLAEEVKAKYFTAARRANDDHKKKYPDYHYNPKEARMRKMFKLQQQNMGHLVTASHH